MSWRKTASTFVSLGTSSRIRAPKQVQLPMHNSSNNVASNNNPIDFQRPSRLAEGSLYQIHRRKPMLRYSFQLLRLALKVPITVHIVGNVRNQSCV